MYLLVSDVLKIYSPLYMNMHYRRYLKHNGYRYKIVM